MPSLIPPGDGPKGGAYVAWRGGEGGGGSECKDVGFEDEGEGISGNNNENESCREGEGAILSLVL